MVIDQMDVDADGVLPVSKASGDQVVCIQGLYFGSIGNTFDVHCRIIRNDRDADEARKINNQVFRESQN